MLTRWAKYKIGDYALWLDLLGVANRMADLSKWDEPLDEIYNVVRDSMNETIDITDKSKSQPLYQHGDSIVFSNDDPQALITLGIRLLTLCFEKNILAQLGLAGGGAYFIPDSQAFSTRTLLHSKANIQMLVGPAVARSYLILKGACGPRFLLDDEVQPVPPSNRWKRYMGTTRHQPNRDAGMRFSEVYWWVNFVGNKAERRIQLELKQTDVAIQRRKHLEAFLNMLTD